MTPPERLALAEWYLDRLTPYREAFNVMTPTGHRSKYFKRGEELTPELVALALDGKRRDRGRGPILSIAAHRLQQDGRAKCAALDIDTGGEAAARRALTVCADHGLWAFASLSASDDHDGAHVWIPFDDLQDAAMLLDLARRIQATGAVAGEAYPTAAALRLPAMTHLRAPSGPRVFPILLQNGDELTGDGWAIVEALRASWQANTEAQLWEADSKLPALSTERPAIRHKSEIQPTDMQRVIDWYISQVSIEEALEDIGLTVDGRARAYLCPFHDDHNPSLGILPHKRIPSARVARCFAPHCRAHRPVTSFDMFCEAEHLDPGNADDRRRAVFLIAEKYRLGRRKETRIETAPQTGTPARLPYTEEIHQELLSAQRYGLTLYLSDVVEEALTAGPARKRVLALRAAPGMGKTTAGADAANRATAAGLRVAIVAPNHKHAQHEWAERLADPYIWRPRKALCTCYETSDLAEWGNRGYAAPPCTDPACPYRLQHAVANGKQVIFQYAHLTLRGGELLNGYDLVIIDESPAGALLQETAVSLAELQGLARRDAACAPLCNALVKVANTHYMKEIFGPDLIQSLRRYCDLDQALADATFSPSSRPHPPAPTAPDIPAAKLPRVFLPDLLQALTHDAERPDGNALLTWGRTSDGWRYIYHRRGAFLPEMWNRLDGPAVVVLDGSADATIYTRLFAPWPVRLVNIGAPISPVVRIIQAPGVASTRRVMQDGRADAVPRHIAAIANELRLTIAGGISYKGLAPVLAEQLGGDWSLHYGAQRGRNGLENAGVVAVVASPTAPPGAIEREARALWRDDPPIDATKTRVGVADFTYADERLARVARSHGPEELRQAVHRARLVTRTTPTTVIVASPWQLAPLGLPVAATITELPAAQSAASRDALVAYRQRAAVGTVEIPAILESAKNIEAHSPPDSEKAEISTIAPPPPRYQPPPPEVRSAPISQTALAWREFAHGHAVYRTNGQRWQRWQPVRGWEDIPPGHAPPESRAPAGAAA